MAFVYQARQAQVLKESILASHLVDEVFLTAVEEQYLKNPYHNFVHALKVAEYVLQLSLKNWTIEEIVSLLVAALFHDAQHQGYAQPQDELNSIHTAFQVIENLPKEHKNPLVSQKIVHEAIIGTVFSQRAKNTNRYGKVLADLDIGVLGESLAAFLYYSVPTAAEFGDNTPQEYFVVRERGYFKFLLSIDNCIMISPEGQTLLPNSLATIKEYIALPFATKEAIWHTLQNEDITFSEFEARFFPVAIG